MSARTMVLEHRNQLMQLRRLADADLAALTSVTAGLSVAEARETVIEVLPELVGPYITASGELAATMFEDIRAEASRRGTFYAESAAALPSAQRVSGTSRWAVGAMVDDAAQSTLTTRLSGSVTRMIMDASRDTMQLNGAREKVRFQRMPRGADACSFCVMLASRPAWMAYTSAANAQAGSHDNCHCVVVGMYPGTEMADLGRSTRDRFMQIYSGREKV